MVLMLLVGISQKLERFSVQLLVRKGKTETWHTLQIKVLFPTQYLEALLLLLTVIHSLKNIKIEASENEILPLMALPVYCALWHEFDTYQCSKK